MVGALEIRLAVDAGGVSPHAYVEALDQITRSVEELDRLAETKVKDRASWFIADTSWREAGPVVRLLPRLSSATTRTTEQLVRPSRAFILGVDELHRLPEIPDTFTENIVRRVMKVGALAEKPTNGLREVSVGLEGSTLPPARLDAEVSGNADRAIAPRSLAYGSIIGRLDLISARGRSRRVGLVAEQNRPITCVVDALEEDLYLGAFDRRVLVEGLIRRNSAGQVIRIDADRLTMLEPVRAATAADLLGFLPPTETSVTAFIEEQRGRT